MKGLYFSQLKNARLLNNFYLWWEKIKSAFDAGGQAGQDDSGVALEALCAAVDDGNDGRLDQVSVVLPGKDNFCFQFFNRLLLHLLS